MPSFLSGEDHVVNNELGVVDGTIIFLADNGTVKQDVTRQ